MGTAAGCGFPSSSDPGGGSARLTARPGTPSGTVTAGLTKLGLGTSRDGYLYVPESYVAGHPTPFLMALHGAGIPAQGPLNLMTPYADSHGFLLLSVDSADYTWDAMVGRYGMDVAFLDQALQRAFARCSVDPDRVVVSGFSDGASYGLGLGLANGDLFSRVVAFSPGFISPSDTPAAGHPEFFFSHGRQDPVLPIDVLSRRPPPARGAGLRSPVEFEGDTTSPRRTRSRRLTWFCGRHPHS